MRAQDLINLDGAASTSAEDRELALAAHVAVGIDGDVFLALLVERVRALGREARGRAPSAPSARPF